MSEPWLSPGMGSLLGGLAGGGMGFLGASSANRQNRALSREQMAFQGYQSNTAHQRQVKDLKAAGLNPMLSAMSGASSPQGAMAQMQNEGQAAVAGAKELAAVTSQTKLNEQNQKTSKATAGAAGAQMHKTAEELKLLTMQEGAIKAENKARQESARVEAKYAEPNAIANLAGKAIQGAAVAAGTVTGLRAAGQGIGALLKKPGKAKKGVILKKNPATRTNKSIRERNTRRNIKKDSALGISDLY